MVDVRQWLAVGLGALFGLFLILAPRAALKLSVLTGGPQRRRDDYGADDTVPVRWVWATRAVGVVCLGVAAYIAL